MSAATTGVKGPAGRALAHATATVGPVAEGDEGVPGASGLAGVEGVVGASGPVGAGTGLAGFEGLPGLAGEEGAVLLCEMVVWSCGPASDPTGAIPPSPPQAARSAPKRKRASAEKDGPLEPGRLLRVIVVLLVGHQQ